MAELPLFDRDGKNIGTVAVDEKIFGDKVKTRLLHQVVVMYEANKRQGNASTKTKGEVEGSTRKPWPQKHTGMARSGTVRSPIWRHGGVVFGPRPHSFKKTITASTRHAALDSALLGKIRDKEVSVIEKLEFDKPKTKLAAAVLGKIGFKRTVLIGTKAHDPKIHLATRNLPSVRLLPIRQWNAYDVLKYKDLLLTREALDEMVAARKAK